MTDDLSHTSPPLARIPGQVQMVLYVWVPDRGWLAVRRSMIYGGRHGEPPMIEDRTGGAEQVIQHEAKTAFIALQHGWKNAMETDEQVFVEGPDGKPIAKESPMDEIPERDTMDIEKAKERGRKLMEASVEQRPEDLLPFPTTDAKQWVKAFRLANPGANVDDGTMLAWFANAIEHGRGPQSLEVDPS